MKSSEFITELAYAGNIGIMELAKFHSTATPEQKVKFKQLMAAGKKAAVWKLVQSVVGVKLQGKEFNENENKGTYQPPELSVGDALRVGKFKNVKAEIQGFSKDKNNQPTVKTDKGTQQLFKPRISKLMPDQVKEGANKFTDEIINEWSKMSGNIRGVMEKKGYTFLGQGVDQAAYEAPDGGVLKIFGAQFGTRPGSLSKDQEMAVAWINFCQANSDNPFLPKFGGWETFTWNNRNYLQIKMERLGKFPLNWDENLGEIADIAARWPKGDQAFDRWEISVGNSEEKKYGEHGPSDAASELAIHLGLENIKLLFSTLASIISMAKSKGWLFDLHSGNWMIRNDGFPVIVDPVVHKSTANDEHIRNQRGTRDMSTAQARKQNKY